MKNRVGLVVEVFALLALGALIHACGSDNDEATAKHDSGKGGGDSSGSGGKPSGGSGGTTASGGNAGSGGTTPAPSWDWVGIVGTGQSLSVGAKGYPLTQTTQPYQNLMLSLGNLQVPPFDPSSSELSLIPLVEPIRTLTTNYPSAYPANVFGETPHTAMGNQVTKLATQAGATSYVTVHTVVGESGQGLNVIEKGATDTGDTGRAYAATLFEAAAIAKLAAAQGKTYGIGAIIITHGETDAGNSSYEDGLYKLWSDYNTDLSSLTGQTRKIPMLVTQQQGVPAGGGLRPVSTQAQWKIGVDHVGDVVCVGPKYQYPYADDELHLTAAGYDRLGEKYGEVYFERVVLGNDWQPLEPTTVELSGNVITVHFHVPVPPLVWEDGFPAPHQSGISDWAKGRGFEVSAQGSPVAVDSVAISGDAVQITCASPPGANGVVVRYAMTADTAAMPGGTVRWGQLRDSDPFVGATTGVAQPNHCVSFELPVP